MSDGFEILGVRELVAALEKVTVDASVTAARIVAKGEALVEAEVKKSFPGAHKAGTPTTSAPGSPPDVVTGTLRRSVFSEPVKRSLTGATGRVYPTVVYARIQELGGRTGRGGHTVLPARPYFTPAVQRVQPRLRELAEREWGSFLH